MQQTLREGRWQGMKDINHAQNASAAVLQASVQRRPAGASVSHHLLTTYVRSYLAVIRSQFSCKGVQGGREVWRPLPSVAPP